MINPSVCLSVCHWGANIWSWSIQLNSRWRFLRFSTSHQTSEEEECAGRKEGRQCPVVFSAASHLTRHLFTFGVFFFVSCFPDSWNVAVAQCRPCFANPVCALTCYQKKKKNSPYSCTSPPNQRHDEGRLLFLLPLFHVTDLLVL